MIITTSNNLSLNFCLHCGQSMGFNSNSFCCSGCEVVYNLLQAQGLEKFYELKPKKLLPLLHYFSRKKNLDWVDEFETESSASTSGTIHLQIEGIQCSACVWVIREVGRREGVQVFVNPSLGQLSLNYDPQSFSLKPFLEILQNLGYRCSPQVSEALPSRASSLLIRLGVCVAIAMNSMFLSIAVYLGLNSGELFSLFHKLNLGLSFVSVIVGGSYFFDRAFRSLQQKMVHFDLPIAIGIAGVFSGSVYAYFYNLPQYTYFDTLNIFIALMLLGRYVQERVLEKNRKSLLQDDAFENYQIREIKHRQVVAKTWSQIQKQDRLLINPGSLFPVNSQWLSEEIGEVDLSSINGESQPVLVTKGQNVLAGARLLSHAAVEVEAQQDYAQGYLAQIFQNQSGEETFSSVWSWITRWYVFLVLSVATGGGLVWWYIDSAQAPLIVFSVLVVTCPCSLGLSLPLAASLAHKILLQKGILVRRSQLLERLDSVSQIFFDKTGTLTLARLKIQNPEEILGLPFEDQEILFNAVARSRHPASLALYEFLFSKGYRWQSNIEVKEEVGRGLEIQTAKQKYFLGRSVSDQNKNYTASFYKEDHCLITIQFEETLLKEAQEVIQDLQKNHEKKVAILSGDDSLRVQQIGEKLSLENFQLKGNLTPQAKADYIQDQHQTLMIGDGLNDALAMEKAGVSGAPLWEFSPLSQKVDFLFIAGHLRWLPQLFEVARNYKKITRTNLRFALIYNSVAVSLALAGWITPLICAVIMPVGSISVLSWTHWQMRRVEGL